MASTTPITLHWEDFTPGWRYESEPRAPLTARELTTFAREYDPQSYHTDDEAAKVVCSMTGRQHFRRRVPAQASAGG